MTDAARSDFNVALNGYRGLCAGLVFLYHLGSAGVLPWPTGGALADGLSYLWSSLCYGVEMFFMISGFVILGSLLRHATIAGFLQDRCIRIFSAWVPVLMAVTAICSALNMKMLADLGVSERLGLFAANLLLLPPLVPLPMIHWGSWSLTFEWVFYLTAALGALLLRVKPAPTWAVLCWAVCALLFICVHPQALFFLTGVIVFARRHWFERHARWLRFPLLSLLVFLLAWRATGIDRTDLEATVFAWLADGRWIAAALAFAASLHMFACVALNARGEIAFLESRPFQFLGTISYSFYLWHALVMAAVKRVIGVYVVPAYGIEVGFTLFAVLCLAIALPLSWASWKVFEVGLGRIARRRLAPKTRVGGVARAA